MIKKVLLNLLAIKNRQESRYKDFIQRHRILFVQFCSIRKKTTCQLLKRYSLSRTQKKDIDSFYKANYGKSITKKWHNYLASYNQTFDVRYIPMSIYYGEIEYFMNPDKAYVHSFENKSIISLIAKANGIKTPKAIYTCSCGQLFDENLNSISLENIVKSLSKQGEFFVKPTMDSCSGAGCSLHKINSEGKDLLSDRSVEDILKSLGDNYEVQKVLRNHQSISKIYDKSLNTLRVITYQWKGRIYNVPVIMRMGRNGAHVDNACAGGIYIGVDEDGQLHKNAYSLKGETVTEHPNSHIVFANHRILSLTETIAAAVKMHRSLPMLGIINWDFAIDESGTPVLIEANITGGGGSWMCQIAHGKGLFGNNTAEILQWLHLMKSLPIYKRNKYYFGKNME